MSDLSSLDAAVLVDLVDSGMCTPECLFGRHGKPCSCRCDGAFHAVARGAAPPPKPKRSGSLPPRRARWYTPGHLGISRVSIDCEGCGSPTADYEPAVMAYVGSADVEPHRHEAWRSAGWLAMVDCKMCGHSHTYPVTTKELAAWDARGWEPTRFDWPSWMTDHP